MDSVGWNENMTTTLKLLKRPFKPEFAVLIIRLCAEVLVSAAASFLETICSVVTRSHLLSTASVWLFGQCALLLELNALLKNKVAVFNVYLSVDGASPADNLI